MEILGSFSGFLGSLLDAKIFAIEMLEVGSRGWDSDGS